MGLHTVVATDTLTSGTGTARLLWAPPRAANDSTRARRRAVRPAAHRAARAQRLLPARAEWEGPVDLARVDPVISFYFQHTVLERPYHVEWLGRLYVPQAGVYTLSTEQLSSSTLTLDGEEVLVNRNPNSLQGVTRPLTAGWHSIKLAYLDDQGYSHMYLYWTPPGYPQSIIPSAFLWPDLGQYPTAPAGGWPTLSASQGGAAPGGPPPPVASRTAAPPDNGPAGPAGQPLNPSVTLGLNGAPLPHPRAAAVDSAGGLYILTELDSQIYVFTPNGQPVTSWAVAGADGKPLIEGSALLFENGRLLALDAASASLMAYDLTGKSLGKIRLCDCFYPRAVAPAQGGGYWVADTGNGRVLKVNATGAATSDRGRKGQRSGPICRARRSGAGVGRNAVRGGCGQQPGAELYAGG